MAINNPLQKYFRQPKIFIKIPSGGVYCQTGTISGDPSKLAVFGMTGMDEILLKTPDALLSGESVVRIIESCVPEIKDAWDLSNIDIDAVLSAIRIATYGQSMSVTRNCQSCGEENDYDLDLSYIIDHYSKCVYNSRLVLDDLVVTVNPLTYRQMTDFNLRNFEIQQQLKQLDLEDKANKKILADMFIQLGELQNEIFAASIESVSTDSVTVTERGHIIEWVQNADMVLFDQLKELAVSNQQNWEIPQFDVVCSHCNAEGKTAIQLDAASFFAKA